MLQKRLIPTQYFITAVVAISAIFGSGCTRNPNDEDGTIQLQGAVGTIAVSPGFYKNIKDKISSGVNSRSYSKSDGKERVTLAGSEGNEAVFETGASAGTADFRIKGSKKFVDNVVARAESIAGAKATLTHISLLAETMTYSDFRESQVVALEEELSKTMTSVGRSSSSFNHSVTIKNAFEKGINGVLFKFSGKDASLKVTIEGDQEFVDEIRHQLDTTKDNTRNQ